MIKSKEELELELEKYSHNILDMHESQLQNYENEYNFIKGLAYGLIYGVIGNVFVQSLNPIVEGIVLLKYDVLFYFNLALMVIAIIILSITTFYFYKQIKIIHKKLKSLIDSFHRYQKKEKEFRKQIDNFQC